MTASPETSGVITTSRIEVCYRQADRPLAELRASSASMTSVKSRTRTTEFDRVQGDGCHKTMAGHGFVQGNLRDSLEVGSGPGAAIIVNNRWKHPRQARAFGRAHRGN